MMKRSKLSMMALMAIGIVGILLASSANATTYIKLNTHKFDLTGAHALLEISPGPSYFHWSNVSDDGFQANITNSGAGLLVTDPLDVTGHYKYRYSLTPNPENTTWVGGDEPVWEMMFNYTAARAHTDGVVRLHLVLHNLLGTDNIHFDEGVGYIVGFVNATLDSVIVTTYNMGMNLTLLDNNITTDIQLTTSIQDAIHNLTGTAYLAMIVFGHGGNQTGTGVGQLDMRGSALYVSGSSSGHAGTSTATATATGTDSSMYLYGTIVVVVLIGVALVFLSKKPNAPKPTRAAPRNKRVKNIGMKPKKPGIQW